MDGTPILFDDGNPDRVSVAEVLVEPLITAAAERVGAADWARALARGKQLSL